MSHWRDDLFEELTSGPVGQWLMAWPVVPIDLELFIKAEPAAGESAAGLVNVIPERPDVYVDSGRSVDLVYGEVLDKAQPVLGTDTTVWTKRRDTCKKLFDDSSIQSAESPRGVYHDVILEPSDWYKTASEVAFQSKLDSGEPATVGCISCVVTVKRPWFDSDFLAETDWRFPGRVSGSISSGQIGEGIMSAVISSLLVVKEISLTVSGSFEWPVRKPGIFGFGLSPVPRCPSVD